jgi:Cd2+/Zn2+-exporting ATPase
MDCAEEIDALRREVGPAVGGEDRLSFDLLGGQMVVAADGDAVPDAVIIATARKAGLDATPIGSGFVADFGWWQRRGRLVVTVASGCGIGAGMLIHGLIRPAAGVGCCEEPSARHEPAHDHRGGRGARAG